LAPAQAWSLLKTPAREMRHLPTLAEKRLWELVRDKRLNGLKFRRQHAIGHFIADFYCPAAKLAIEVDGPIHESQDGADRERQTQSESLGIAVLRFSNDEVSRARMPYFCKSSRLSNP
jgi:very-short-patch-repair endonuclease